MTAISIDTLRKNIRPPMKDERKDEDLWKFFDITNCYSYAFGLLFDFRFLQPGEISKMEPQNQYSDDELVERVKSDLTVLGMKIRESTLEEVVADENSWKIAILNARTDSAPGRYDRHRRDEADHHRYGVLYPGKPLGRPHRRMRILRKSPKGESFLGIL